MSVKENWLERNPKKSLLVLYSVLLILAEFTVRLLAAYGFLSIAYFPTSNVEKRYLGDINPHFGVWHYPNRSVRHQSPCFDVTYHSNSYGARDSERNLNSNGKSRVVLLGDSFVEGVGVTAESRMSNIAERELGIEFLNFGVSGSFGSVQQWLLYRELASKFEHDQLAIFLLPSNDFSDNSPDNFPEGRYRPYIRKNEKGSFEVYYTVAFEDREALRDLSKMRRSRREIYNRVYLLNLIRQLGAIVEGAEFTDAFLDNTFAPDVVSYKSFSEDDLDRLFFSYTQILKLAGERKVRLFIIPRQSDFEESESARQDFPIVDRLQQFAADYPQLEVYDLLPKFIEYAKAYDVHYDKFFHRCDGHWSELGNKVAAQMLVSVVSGETSGLSEK